MLSTTNTAFSKRFSHAWPGAAFSARAHGDRIRNRERRSTFSGGGEVQQRAS